MHRRQFLQSSCWACGALALSGVLNSCAGTQPVAGSLEGDELILPTSAFLAVDGSTKRYVVATHAQLKHPIAVFANPDGSYQALLMRCTHKGVELRVTGARLECNAHGSTFDHTGAVLEGPASAPLRTFSVHAYGGHVRIALNR